MRESNGQYFYTAADVNHGKVRDAMRKVGDDLMRAQFPENADIPLPAETPHIPNERRGHQYGPHDLDTAPVTVTILGPGKWPKEIQAPLPPVMVKQRARINHLAHQRGSR